MAGEDAVKIFPADDLAVRGLAVQGYSGGAVWAPAMLISKKKLTMSMPNFLILLRSSGGSKGQAVTGRLFHNLKEPVFPHGRTQLVGSLRRKTSPLSVIVPMLIFTASATHLIKVLEISHAHASQCKILS
jgi:hypothetical protein